MPALLRLIDGGQAGHEHDRDEAAEGLRLDQLRQSHRIPAVKVSAADASIITAMVKRARIAFTLCGPLSTKRFIHRIGGWAISRRRPLALRPRLATGLPWTSPVVEGGCPRRGTYGDHRAEPNGRVVPGPPPFGGVAGAHQPGGT